MKIALAQMEIIPGRPKRNLETMLAMIEEAKAKKVDLIAFPEMSVGGYLLGDKWTSDAFCRDLMRHNDALLKASNGIAIAYGNIFLDDKIGERTEDYDDDFHPNKDGRIRKYNAVYVIQNGKPVERMKETMLLPKGVQPKTLLPAYRIFDDERYFFSTKDVADDFGESLEDLMQPFMIEVGGKKVPVGFELCEDLWCEDYRRDSKVLNPTRMLRENGAELTVNLSASPWTFGKNKSRDRRVQFLKKDSGDNFVPFLYVNCTGVQNNGKNIVTFDGGSTVYNSDGLPIIFGNAEYKQELLVVDSDDLSIKPQKRVEKPRIAQKYQAIVRGVQHMRDVMSMKEQPRYVIGLSGGIDSAVVAAILIQAVGKDKVLGVNMPTRYNSTKTKDAAAYIAEQLGIIYEIIPIEELVEQNTALLESVSPDGSGRKLTSANIENVQAKIRGTSILSNLAAKYGALFTNNGNKLETAIGYATLYGDIGGALAPIADLTKTEVVELAKYLNDEVFKREVIPAAVIPDRVWRFRKDQIQPSAELKDDQVDPMKFGYHCALLSAMTDYKKVAPEDVMRLYLEGKLHHKLDNHLGLAPEERGLGYELMKRWGVDNPREFVKDLEWFSSGIEKSVFKRVQSPPIIITSKSAYGYDIRESILPCESSLEFDELKERVLALKEYTPRNG